MEFSILGSNLRRVLSIVGRAVATRSTMPVLQNALLVADSGGLVVSATNLAIGITSSVGAKVITPGRITLPAALLQSVVNNQGDEVITMTLDEKTQTMNIVCGRSRTQIRGIDADEFPTLPNTVSESTMFPLGLLRDAINQTIIATGDEVSRPLLSGVQFLFRQNQVKLGALNGFCLAKTTINLAQPCEPRNVIIPAQALREVARIGGDEDIEFGITPSGGQAIFRMSDMVIVTRLIEGDFPDYQRIIPLDGDDIVFDRAEMRKALQLSSLFVDPMTYGVSIDIKDNSLRITSKTSEHGGQQYDIDCETPGTVVRINLSVKLLLAGLSVINTEKVIMRVCESTKPVILHSPNDDTFVYLIMPINPK